MAEPVLDIRNLVVEFATPDGIVSAVNGVSYSVGPGDTLGVVGESGSGKSVTVMSILRLIPDPPGRIVDGQILYRGDDLLQLDEEEIRAVRGNEIAMVFQDPMTSLNPVFTVGDQIDEIIAQHHPDQNGDVIRRRTIDLLSRVGVPNAEVRYHQYPHEYSGGMRQRAMIAMAIANRPRVLIADEPTTALDVTIQAQVLEVLRAAQRDTNAATILITHDLGLIAEMADRVVVMYGGRVVEAGDVRTIFHHPRHPYTIGLMSSLPRMDADLERLAPIEGSPPSMLNLPPGCAFHPRCRLYRGRQPCRTDVPQLYDFGGGHGGACHYHEETPQLRREVSEEIGLALGGDGS